MNDAGARPARSMLAFVNAAIDELQRSLGLDGTQFFCECGSSGCKERITLTRTEYASLLEASKPVVVEAHADPRATAVSELRDHAGPAGMPV